MPTLVILSGLPGSGKSTLAGRLVKRGFYRLNADSLRQMLFCSVYVQRDGQLVFDLLRELLWLLCRQQVNIVWDNTSLETKIREKVASTGRLYGYRVLNFYLDVPLDVCQERNVEPGRHRVPVDVINRMSKKLQTEGTIPICPRYS